MVKEIGKQRDSKHLDKKQGRKILMLKEKRKQRKGKLLGKKKGRKILILKEKRKQNDGMLLVKMKRRKIFSNTIQNEQIRRRTGKRKLRKLTQSITN